MALHGSCRLEKRLSMIGERHGQELSRQPQAPRTNLLGMRPDCPVKSLACGNGSERTMHPAELFGEDWCVPGDWGIEPLIVTDKTVDDGI